MRPDVAMAFDRMAAAARREAGLALFVSSGFRSDAEQAKLFAAHPDPKWVAPPGESLHRYATELSDSSARADASETTGSATSLRRSASAAGRASARPSRSAALHAPPTGRHRPAGVPLHGRVVAI